jgi:hypothetical protein
LGAVAVTIILVAATAFAQTGVGHVLLRKLGLSQRPAGYSALAFQRPLSLPPQLGSRPRRVMVSFTISNDTPSLRDYSWSVRLVQGKKTRPIDAGKARILSGHTTSITRSVAISCRRGQAWLVVKIRRPAIFIDALAQCRDRKS